MITYADYLRLSDLLAQRQPRSEPVEHDELLFITAHQTCELWFRQLLTELTDARDHLREGGSYLPRMRLLRCRVIERLLADQFDVLDTMAAPDFLRFRDVLGTASGAQSAQYREIERVSAALWDGFLIVLRKAGFPVADKEERVAAYRQVAAYREDHTAVWELAEALVEHDQAWSHLRYRHVLAAERQIGRMPGTAGSSGVDHLAARCSRRFYPELWELRSLLV